MISPVFGPLSLLALLLPAAVLVVLYWVIRLAVRDGQRDAQNVRLPR